MFWSLSETRRWGERAGIHHAVGCDRVERPRALLAQNASAANACDGRGQTRLHCLLERGIEIIDLLAAQEAKSNVKDYTMLGSLRKSGPRS